MSSMIVAGATGAIGRTVVQYAIRQPSIHRVVAITRSTNLDASNYEQLFGVVTASPLDAASAAEKDSEAIKKQHHASTPDRVVVTAEQAAKIKPVTVDWEAFTNFWAALDRSSIASAAETTPGPYNEYKELFTGHTYAAMCLGTTRKEAGSAAQFIRCDYDYVITFTEAVMAFSAPSGLAPQNTFIHHLGDGAEAKKPAATPSADAEKATPADATQALRHATALTSGTLHAFAQISAQQADSNSWLLYMRTKGMADEATVERVQQHNKANAAAGAAAASSPVKLHIMRPGLLQRHGKARFNEKLARIVMTPIAVELVGAAAVSACLELAPTVEQLAKKSKDVEGKPFTTTKVMKKAGVPADETYAGMYEYHNSAIKHLAERLAAEQPVAAAAAAAAEAATPA